ncbi:MAG: HupE/UreJ family protein [Colwellia sp.]
MNNKITLAIILFVLTSLCSSVSYAHTRSQSFSQWQVNNNKVSVNFTVLTREITRLAADASIDVSKSLAHILAEHLQGKIKAFIDEQQCNFTQPFSALPANKGYTKFEAQLICGKGSSLRLEVDAFFDIVPSHLHYARIIRANGVASEIVLSDAVRSQTINLQDTNKNYGQIISTYIALGIEHILIGYDHLVFLFALLLLCRRATQALMLVTGFTLGHTITLFLSVLGWLQPDTITIEALIGFSIALLALEKIQSKESQRFTNKIIFSLVTMLTMLILTKLLFNMGLAVLTLLGLIFIAFSYLLLVKDNNSRSIAFLLTTVFGFIHGFGFAEVLREIGLPNTELGLALLSFNIGVELGQLLALVLMTILGYIFIKFSNKKQQEIVAVGAISVVLGLGCYWFMVRSLA